MLGKTKPFHLPVPFAAVCLTVVLGGVLLLPCTASAAIGQRSSHDRTVLRFFARQTVYVVTNDDPAIADTLLENCGEKARHVLTIDEWRKMPASVRPFVSPIFLINRERLPEGIQVPAACPANGNDVWTEVRHIGRSGGPNYEVTLSAPDGVWLRRAVASFRLLQEVPRQPLRRSVRSIVVIPVGSGAGEAAAFFVRQQNTEDDFNKRTAAHTLPLEFRQTPGVIPSQCASMEEVVLIDRGSAGESDAALPAGKMLASPGDTVVWRESKPDGRSRTVYSAPSAGALYEAMRRPVDPITLSEAPTVLSSARDLRTVRRVAVAGVRNGVGGAELARRMASEAAIRLRALDKFEVLERAGLNEILGEVALDQAGITHAKDRTHVRQLAAADTLLIVEITGIDGRTEYTRKAERLTPPMGPAPRRPAEPTHLRYDILFRGSEDNTLLRSVTESFLARAIGTKSRREYRSAMDDYNETVLPRWQDETDRYYAQREKRQIDWKQNIAAESAATVKGSLRLVDLTDGLVLWETPFSATEKSAENQAPRRALTYGEDSGEPGLPDDVPEASDSVSDSLMDRAMDSALEEGIRVLKGTALLPSPIAAETTTESILSSASKIQGRLLDVDGDSLLIGLGTGDGVKLGDVLRVTLADGKTVRVMATRVRPRTCDAAFTPDTLLSLRTRTAIGQTVMREAKK